MTDFRTRRKDKQVFPVSSGKEYRRTDADIDKQRTRKFKGTPFTLSKDGYVTKEEAQKRADEYRKNNKCKVRVKNIGGSWGFWIEADKDKPQINIKENIIGDRYGKYSIKEIKNITVVDGKEVEKKEFILHEIGADGTDEGYAGRYKSREEAISTIDRWNDNKKDSIKKDISLREVQVNGHLDAYITEMQRHEDYYHKHSEEKDSSRAREIYRKRANTARKNRDKAEAYKEFDGKGLNITGKAKLRNDFEEVLRDNFNRNPNDRSRFVTPNIHLEYTRARVSGRYYRAKHGIPTIQMSSTLQGKNIDDRKYRAVMIHEITHYLRDLHKDNIGRGWAFESNSNSESEEKATVMETQQRAGKGVTARKHESYYAFLNREIPYEVGAEDNKTLTSSAHVNRVTNKNEIAENIYKRHDKTYINRLKKTGKRRWVDRAMFTKDGNYMQSYDPSGRKPDVNKDMDAIDIADGAMGDDYIFTAKRTK